MRLRLLLLATSQRVAAAQSRRIHGIVCSCTHAAAADEQRRRMTSHSSPQVWTVPSRVTRHTSHVTRHTSHVTRHTSHVTRHTSHVSRLTSHVTRHTSHVTRHTSHVTRHTSHDTRHTSHVTRHTSHVTRHTSHVTRHTSHVTRHTSHSGLAHPCVHRQLHLVHQRRQVCSARRPRRRQACHSLPRAAGHATHWHFSHASPQRSHGWLAGAIRMGALSRRRLPHLRSNLRAHPRALARRARRRCAAAARRRPVRLGL
jgi:hypothetical protein